MQPFHLFVIVNAVFLISNRSIEALSPVLPGITPIIASYKRPVQTPLLATNAHTIHRHGQNKSIKCILRNTFIASTSLSVNDQPHSPSPSPLLSWMLGIAYMSIIAAVMTLPAVLALISADIAFLRPDSSQVSMEATLSIATLAIMGGKIVSGPATDKLGGSKV